MAKIRLQVAGLSILLLGAALTLSISAETPGVAPRNGFVPDEGTAIAIAEAVLKPIYGQDQIIHERPFLAHLDWKVEGSLPDGWDRGVAVVRIRRSDGKILYMMHAK